MSKYYKISKYIHIFVKHYFNLDASISKRSVIYFVLVDDFVHISRLELARAAQLAMLIAVRLSTAYKASLNYRI